MKSFIVLALVAAVAADVSHLNQDRDAQIVSQNSDVHPEGFSQSFQTSNGISAQESGQLKNVGREDEALEVQGANSYVAPDGSRVETSFIANENGYQPQGAHLPTPPPPQEIPEYIARAIAYIAAHPPKPEPSVPLQQSFYGLSHKKH